MHIGFSSRTGFTPAASILWLGCVLIGGHTVAADLSVEEAKWESGDANLVVKGKNAGNRAVVTIYNAGGGPGIASTTASEGGEWELKKSGLASVPCRVQAEAGDMSAEKDVSNAPSDCDAGDGGGGTPPPVSGNFTILAHNDLGMHCADKDYRIFSILPPYSVVNAQVLLKGAKPRLVSPDDDIYVTYEAVASSIVDPNDDEAPPSATDSITSTSQNTSFDGEPVFKTNFWELSDNGVGAWGLLAYDPLYPTGLLGSDDFPFDRDLGLPAPNVEELYLVSGILTAEQSAMPGRFDPYSANEPQPFHGYVRDFPFFVGDHDGNGAQDFPFGYVAENFRRYTAEGVPVMPTDDQGREQAYPVMHISARDAEGIELASVEAVLPVASEADCQGCHLAQEVCNALPGANVPCDDIANYYNGTKYDADFIESDTDLAVVPGDTDAEKALNAAKINILRLHDAVTGTGLDIERNIVCAKCHYSPALDLAQLGPNDDNGKEQTRHVSMSRAMHYFHGKVAKSKANDPDRVFRDLFPTMPPPSDGRLPDQGDILGRTCYSCHPGKRTKCLRGAMEYGGIVCQDCHGQSRQVGNDFTVRFPKDPGAARFGKRVPWANEPTCQSCHVGDVLQTRELQNSGQLADAAVNDQDKAGNEDGLRLLMSYPLAEHKSNGGNDRLKLYDFGSSRFASNLPLYRLSGGEDGSDKGHGGLSCEGCHGSTHAIWPNPNPWANDNKTAMGLQGHVGTIIECETCHEGDLGNTLEGPHGMHTVGGTSFVDGGHDDLADQDKDACRSCHGADGEGTVLSRAAVDRTFTIEECEHGTLCPNGEVENFTVQLDKGQPIACDLCHENKL